MEALVDPKIRIVSIIAAIQSGKTSVGELGLSHIIANHPGPTLWLDQTDDDAKDQSESRLQKLFDECLTVRSLYPANRHKKRLATVHFNNGMTLWVLGAHWRRDVALADGPHGGSRGPRHRIRLVGQMPVHVTGW
jgi:phage terminase large subunit GpA-like protein